jgi:hypothetical protein
VRIGAGFFAAGEFSAWNVISRKVYVADGLLRHIGLIAARSFYRERLAKTLHPASFSYTGAPLSKRGRRMVSYSVNGYKNVVIIRSYPLNVLRRGPGPRSAKRTEGAKIFRSFRNSFNLKDAAREALDIMIQGFDSKDEEDLDKITIKQWRTRMRKTRTTGANKL